MGTGEVFNGGKKGKVKGGKRKRGRAGLMLAKWGYVSVGKRRRVKGGQIRSYKIGMLH